MIQSVSGRTSISYWMVKLVTLIYYDIRYCHGNIFTLSQTQFEQFCFSACIYTCRIFMYFILYIDCENRDTFCVLHVKWMLSVHSVNHSKSEAYQSHKNATLKPVQLSAYRVLYFVASFYEHTWINFTLDMDISLYMMETFHFVISFTIMLTHIYILQ